MKISLMTLSALMAATINSTAQTDAQKPVSSQTDKSQNYPSEQPSRMAREKSKQAEAEKTQSEKILEEYRKSQDTLKNGYMDSCRSCGMG
jgi:uncharacterized membrane protein